FKTAWDPDLALARDTVGLLVAYRRTLLDQLGGMRPGFGSTALGLYEFSLRLTFAASIPHIHHIPAILCHRHHSAEQPMQIGGDSARQIVREHLESSGQSARVLPAPL